MTLAGVFFPQRKWERRINEIGSGLWPTPRASLGMAARLTQYGADHAAERNGNLEDKILEFYPLEAVGLYINPQFVEKMMGWPLNWTDASKHLAMDKFQQWQRQFGACFPPNTASTVTAAAVGAWIAKVTLAQVKTDR